MNRNTMSETCKSLHTNYHRFVSAFEWTKTRFFLNINTMAIDGCNEADYLFY